MLRCASARRGRGGIVPPGVPAAFPAATRVVDLDGRYIIPGLWDEHVHMTQWALASNRLDLSGAGSAREAAAVVGSHLAGTAAATEAPPRPRTPSRRWWGSVFGMPSGRTRPAWTFSTA